MKKMSHFPSWYNPDIEFICHVCKRPNSQWFEQHIREKVLKELQEEKKCKSSTRTIKKRTGEDEES